MILKNTMFITTILMILLLNSCGDRAAKIVESSPIIVVEEEDEPIVDKDGDGFYSDVDPDDNNPCNPSLEAGTCDRDGDGLTNNQELIVGTDPINADSDGDNLKDGTDEHNATPYSNPLDACDPSLNADMCDRDGDGLTNAQEIVLGTDPTNPDSDGDGLNDGTDEHNATPYSNPLDACDPSTLAGSCDRDSDGLTNDQEANLTTDPDNPDTDGDGLLDGADVNITTGVSTALLSCLPKQLPLYRDYNNSNAMWIADNCDQDSYSNGAEDNISLAPNNYLSDPYDAKSGCFMTSKVITNACGVNGVIKYCEVTANDGRVWLDRNLGACNVCTSSIDTTCYGELYQWGRGADGHQERASTRTQALNPQTFPYSSMSHELSTSGQFDWLSSDGTENTSGFIAERKASWLSLTNNSVCPKDFYVPTKAELDALAIAEGITDSATAFASVMKFAVSGSRSEGSSAIEQDGVEGYVWSVDSNVTQNTSYAFTYTNAGTLWSLAYRATGYSVRCIKKR